MSNEVEFIRVEPAPDTDVQFVRVVPGQSYAQFDAAYADFVQLITESTPSTPAR
jgi:hypothetical protein